LAFKALLRRFVFDTFLETAVDPAKDGVLAAKAEDGTEVVGTVTDVDDTVEIFAVAFEEGGQLLAYEEEKTNAFNL
jgi:hypothetical protein